MAAANGAINKFLFISFAVFSNRIALTLIVHFNYMEVIVELKFHTVCQLYLICPLPYLKIEIPGIRIMSLDIIPY